ncbi:MAG: hypothetical protein JKY95_10315 [Planctomycetaceae bacterium]|nr:hypothetical protein [Planctomycetaceae bacterium]
MTKLASDLLEFAGLISLRPQMYASSPEEANGILVALSWVVLHETTAKELGACTRIDLSILKDTMRHVYFSETQTPPLCAEEFSPNYKSSFEAFSKNSKVYLNNLHDYLDSN